MHYSQSGGSISSPHARSSILGYNNVEARNFMIIHARKSNYANIWREIAKCLRFYMVSTFKAFLNCLILKYV